MATWQEITEDAPELAALVRARFEATGLAFLATLRAAGSPRISGVEPLFDDGQLWLGMMDGSRKARDLQRDPRFALHAASADKEVSEGDAKLEGRAEEVTDAEVIKSFAGALEEATGNAPPPPYHLFRVDVSSVTLLRLGSTGDHLLIESWHEGQGYQRVERR
jgi:hypothetical protein